MIQFNNLNKSYGDTLVLLDINWSADQGHCVGLVGPNGSGKSTILRLISGVLQPDHGQVLINGKDVFENVEAKRKIFFLGDEPYFFSQSTINDMKEFYKLFYPDFDETLYNTLLDDFKLKPNVKINSFSKGMKRQVVLILALSSKPDILLLDEAFDGLDPLMRFKLRQYISQEISDRKILVVISSHNLRELEDICDQIVMINNKKLQFSHSSEDVHSLYHKFQLVVDEDFDIQKFKDLNPLKIIGTSRIYTLIFKGNRKELEDKLALLNPTILEHDSVSLEEVFIYELEENTDEKSL